MAPHPANGQNNLPRILVLDPIHPDGIALLQQQAQVDLVGEPALTLAELEARIGAYDGVINRSRTRIPASVIERGERLRVIARAGVGLDNIDVAAAEARGIEVINCPEATTAAVAEHTFGLMLGVARQLSRADHSLKMGKWEKAKLQGVGLAGKTLGIIGFGRIGRAVAKRAQGFGMHVIVNQNRPTPELAQTWQVELVDMGDLLARADFVSLHVPLRPSNVNLISANELALMKNTAHLINTSRGGIVDEGALLIALENGQIAGAALDVFMGEPKPNLQLVGHRKVFATPHIAANTEDAQRNAALMAAEQVLAVFKRQSASETLSLRVAPVNKVLPHETYHPARVAKLAERIVADGMLANPPVTVALPGRDTYVVLDGATRVTAFQQLGYPHIVIQTVDLERDNVQLYTWFHALRRNPSQANASKELLTLVRGVKGLRITEMPVQNLDHALWERNALAYLITTDKQGFLLEFDVQQAESGQDWLDVLNCLVDGYGAWGDVERTLNTDVDQLRAQFGDLVGVVVFPQFAPEIVMQIAAKGRLLPAGMTRFVIPGRILRLNAPLKVLASSEPLAQKREWLDNLVQTKLSGRALRYYAEPVVLLDE